MGTEKLKNALFAAIIKMMMPLVRIMLRNGVSYEVFAELAKRTFVKVSELEFKLPGKQQTTTYISTLTGLSRKEVLRIRRLPEISSAPAVERHNRAARVIGAWTKEPDFLDKHGEPISLSFGEGAINFKALVKKSSGDIPARTILDELERIGTVQVREDGRIDLVQRAYIPQGDNIGQLNGLGNDVSELITTIDHNTTCKPEEAYIQRKVCYDNIPDDVFEELQEILKKKAQSALEDMASEMEKRDRDGNENLKGKGKNRAGIGIYYFKEPQRLIKREDTHE